MFCSGVYVNGYRIIDQRVLRGDLTVQLSGDVVEADHPFKLRRRGPR